MPIFKGNVVQTINSPFYNTKYRQTETFEDFINASVIVGSNSSGAGSTGSWPSDNSAFAYKSGIWRIHSGSSASAGAYGAVGFHFVSLQINLYGGAITFETTANFNEYPSSTSSANILIGLLPAINVAYATDPAYGIYFKCGTSSTIDCVTRSGSTSTTTSSGIAASTSGWQKLRIYATTTSVIFYINDVIVANHTTNIPNSSTPGDQRFHGGANTSWVSGTSRFTLHLDYLYLMQETIRT